MAIIGLAHKLQLWTFHAGWYLRIFLTLKVSVDNVFPIFIESSHRENGKTFSYRMQAPRKVECIIFVFKVCRVYYVHNYT